MLFQAHPKLWAELKAWYRSPNGAHRGRITLGAGGAGERALLPVPSRKDAEDHRRSGFLLVASLREDLTGADSRRSAG